MKLADNGGIHQRMTARPLMLLLLPVWLLVQATLLAGTNDSNVFVSRHSDIQFTRPAPYATPKEINRRLGISAGGKVSTLVAEKFQVIVPGTFSTNLPWGLLVWISPGDAPAIPSVWEAELARQQLLFVGAYNSGNQRPIWERVGLAVQAAFNMCRQYKIDTNRIFVAGFSGGGRVAGMVGIGYPDIFTGTICVCGAGFYTDIPTTTGERWERTFIPDAKLLARARSDRRFVLLTGDQDINRENTHEVWRGGFEREGFRHVRYVEVPGLKHALPSAEVLSDTLKFISGTEPQ